MMMLVVKKMYLKAIQLSWLSGLVLRNTEKFSRLIGG